MHVLEYGQEQEKTLLFLPCTAEPVWAFADTVALLSRRWHVFQVIYDGYQPEYAGDFTSVEQTVDAVTEYQSLDDPSVSGFFRFLARVGDGKMKMQIVRMDFASGAKR